MAVHTMSPSWFYYCNIIGMTSDDECAVASSSPTAAAAVWVRLLDFVDKTPPSLYEE